MHVVVGMPAITLIGWREGRLVDAKLCHTFRRECMRQIAGVRRRDEVFAVEFVRSVCRLESRAYQWITISGKTNERAVKPKCEVLVTIECLRNQARDRSAGWKGLCRPTLDFPL